MAYDEALADRVRDLLGPREGVSEQRMFGGIGFMVNGNMACGVRGEDLIVRLHPDQTDQALGEAHIRAFDPTGRPMKGWILVGPAGTSSDDDLAQWVETGAGYAAGLPPK